MAKFGIGIPTLNRADLLIPALQSYVTDFPATPIYVIDNGNQKELNSFFGFEILQSKSPNLYILTMDKNKGVAGSWNIICKKIFEENDFAIILNDDIYWGKREPEVNQFIDKYGKYPLLSNPIDWCNFIIPKSTFDVIGAFDETFYPAYCEDNDYVYRMKLKGMTPYKSPFLLPVVHRASQTLEKDHSISGAYIKNKKRYIQKWGGEPDFEVYKTPFNI